MRHFVMYSKQHSCKEDTVCRYDRLDDNVFGNAQHYDDLAWNVPYDDWEPILDDDWDSSPISVDERPDFGPRQVRSMEEIQVGDIYEMMPKEGRVEVLGLPYQERSAWWLKVRKVDSGYEDTIALADKGVVPYTNGKWHRTNHLLRTE